MCLYYVLDQHIPFIFHFSQLSGIFLSQKQHTCLHKLFLTYKNSRKEYLLTENKSSWQKSPILNFKWLGKTCDVCIQLEHLFFLMCTRLDATDSKLHVQTNLMTSSQLACYSSSIGYSAPRVSQSSGFKSWQAWIISGFQLHKLPL